MNIFEKIAEIMKSVKFVQKDGKVQFKDTKYKYISEAKLTSILRAEFLEKGIVVFPVRQTSNRNGYITHVDVEYKMVNIDDPNDYITIASCGDGADSQDKGASKAMTMAYKYMLLRTFAIPTGDDPDEIGSDELTEKFAKEKEIDNGEREKLDLIICQLAKGDIDRIESFAQRLFGDEYKNLSVPQMRTMKEKIARQVEQDNMAQGKQPVTTTVIKGGAK